MSETFLLPLKENEAHSVSKVGSTIGLPTQCSFIHADDVFCRKTTFRKLVSSLTVQLPLEIIKACYNFTEISSE